MGKAFLRRLTYLCVTCGVAGFVLMGVAAFQDGKREWRHYQAGYQKLLLEKISRSLLPGFAVCRRTARRNPL